MTIQEIKEKQKAKEEIFFLSQGKIKQELIRKVIEVTEVGQPDSVQVYTAGSGITAYSPKNIFALKADLLAALAKEPEKKKPEVEPEIKSKKEIKSETTGTAAGTVTGNK